MIDDRLNSSTEKLNSRLANFEEEYRMTNCKFQEMEIKMNSLEVKHK